MRGMISTSFWRKIMSRGRFLLVVGAVLFVAGLSICAAGPFGLFGRRTGDCASGSCAVVSVNGKVEPEPKPVVVVPTPKPDNTIVDIKPVVVVKNDILNDIPDLPPSNPVEPKPVVVEIVTKEPVKQATQNCEQSAPQVQYNYDDRPRFPILRRIFRGR